MRMVANIFLKTHILETVLMFLSLKIETDIQRDCSICNLQIYRQKTLDTSIKKLYKLHVRNIKTQLLDTKERFPHLKCLAHYVKNSGQKTVYSIKILYTCFPIQLQSLVTSHIIWKETLFMFSEIQKKDFLFDVQLCLNKSCHLIIIIFMKNSSALLHFMLQHCCSLLRFHLCHFPAVLMACYLMRFF